MLANVGGDIVVDSIPLSDVSSVEEINKVSDKTGNNPPQRGLRRQQSFVKSADSAQTRFQYAIQIKTDPAGMLCTLVVLHTGRS